MNVETVSTFKAKINTVEFHDEKNFNSTRILLEHVESKLVKFTMINLLVIYHNSYKMVI